MGCSNSKPKASDPQAPKIVEAPAEQPRAAEEPKQPEKPSDLPLNGTRKADEDTADASPVPVPVHAPSAPVIHDPAASPTPAQGQGDGMGKVDSHGRRKAPAATMPACFYKNGVHNGFKTIPELPSMECDEKWQAPHTLPAAALSYEPSDDAIITKFKNGDQERKIHNNTRLSASEVERLQGMRNEAKTMGVEFYPSVTSMATRFLSRARMDSRKAVKLMKDTQDWRSEFFKDGPITAESVAEDLRYGIVYFCGRDFALRPCIVIRAHRIPQKWYKEKCIDKFIRLLIFCMEYFLRYMIVPGRVENLSVIVDLATLGISQVPLSALGEVYKVMSHHYIGRVFKFYVCNVSGGLSVIAGMAKALLTDRQKQKLNMLDDVSELRKEFALTQLETDLGGNRPIIESFFPFPLVPGPFDAGFDGTPDTSVVSNAHECLSLAGAIGKLWDPKLSVEMNRRLEYTAKAAEILEKCGLPVPPEAHLDAQGSMQSLASGRSAGASFVEGPDGKLHITPETSPSTDMEAAENGGTPVDDLDFQGDEVGIGGNSRDRDLESAAVCGNLFWCTH